MTCGICKIDKEGTITLLPLHQSDGALCVLACEDCTLKSGAWCQTHQKVHQGFEDGSTACIQCINQKVRNQAHLANDIYKRLSDELEPGAFEDIKESAELAGELTDDSTELALLRFIITKAQRTETTMEEVIQELLRKQDAAVILGNLV